MQELSETPIHNPKEHEHIDSEGPGRHVNRPGSQPPAWLTFLDSSLVLYSESFQIVIPTNAALRTLRNKIKDEDVSHSCYTFQFIAEQSREEPNGPQLGY